MRIPFIDLKHQYQSLKADINQQIDAVLSSAQFINGPAVTKFEDSFKQVLSSAQCIGVGNGTDALFIALKTLGITHGDEILTPAFSWISSSEAISLCGAKPIFVDIDSQFYTIDPEKIEERITRRTKAIIIVHLFGQAASVAKIQALARKHGLFIIEDCAQAHLTMDANQYVGTFGDIGTFSFYPTKNLGAYGDAGCLVTNNSMLAEKIRRFRNHGALIKDDHSMEGMNSRMDEIQAAILSVKLPLLKYWNAQRVATAGVYTTALSDFQEVLPQVRPGTEHTFHIYAIRVRNRNQLREYLYEQGIQTLIHYPKALPNLLPYLGSGQLDDFPVATKFQNETLSLPIYPGLSNEQILYVCQKIKDFFRKYT
jgi:dTDP-4-amino-4,6-dideoxygalactose transaminase